MGTERRFGGISRITAAFLAALAVGLFSGNNASAEINRSVCANLLAPKKPAPESEKLELLYMNQALAVHVSKKKYDLAATQKAVVNFISVLDPFQFILLQGEVQGLGNLSTEQLKSVHEQVFSASEIHLFHHLLNLAVERYNFLGDRFVSDKSFRDQLVAKYRERLVAMAVNGRANFSTPRPQNFQEMEAAFLNYMAEMMVSVAAYYRQIPQNITDNEVLVLTIRQMRAEYLKLSMMFNSHTLPVLIAKSYIETLDPHSDLLIASEAKEFARALSGGVTGVGVGVFPSIGGLQLMHIVPNSPAAKAGLKQGDILTHITSDFIEEKLLDKNVKTSWLSIRNLTLSQSQQLMQGVEGSKVKFRVRRGDKNFEVNVERAEINVGEERVKLKIVEGRNGKIAHIHFDAFYHGVGQEVREQLEEALTKHNISGVALDLRNNGGGATLEVAEILGVFIKSGISIVLKDGKGSVESVPFESPKVLWNGPMIVMTNYLSASASEATSGALQDYGRALVVGSEQTYGKGTQQTIHGNDQIFAKITTQSFHTPSGRSPQNEGIKANITLPQGYRPRQFEKDYPNVLAVERIDSLITEKDTMQNNIIEELAAELKLKSQQRQLQSPNQDPNLQHDLNTKESLEILADLIAALRE